MTSLAVSPVFAVPGLALKTTVLGQLVPAAESVTVVLLKPLSTERRLFATVTRVPCSPENEMLVIDMLVAQTTTTRNSIVLTAARLYNRILRRSRESTILR